MLSVYLSYTLPLFFTPVFSLPLLTPTLPACVSALSPQGALGGGDRHRRHHGHTPQALLLAPLAPIGLPHRRRRGGQLAPAAVLSAEMRAAGGTKLTDGSGVRQPSSRPREWRLCSGPLLEPAAGCYLCAAWRGGGGPCVGGMSGEAAAPGSGSGRRQHWQEDSWQAARASGAGGPLGGSSNGRACLQEAPHARTGHGREAKRHRSTHARRACLV